MIAETKFLWHVVPDEHGNAHFYFHVIFCKVKHTIDSEMNHNE